MNPSVYEVKNVSYSTPGGRSLQRGLSFQIRSGQMLLITGSNGCGKSTLLRALLGQFPVDTGTIECSLKESGMEYIPQLENTEVHLPLTLQDVLRMSFSRRLHTEEITKYGLLREDQLLAAWNTASGGERKRTLLTRALLRNPSMLIFDEPMNHLDADSRGSMIRAMSRFLTMEGRGARAIVMVCHQGLHVGERELFDVLHLDLDRGSEA